MKRIAIAFAAILLCACVVAVAGWDTFARHQKNGTLAQGFGSLFTQIETKAWNCCAFWVRVDPLTAEDANARAALPEYKTIPAATKLTPAQSASPVTTWHRSHGNSANTRYTTADQITPENVGQVQQLWTYAPPNGTANVQANPIYADGRIYLPDSAHTIVALNPTDGTVLWRFDPQIKFPAKRGLVYWGGTDQLPARIYFAARGKLFALNAKTGKPVAGFNGGAVSLGYEAKIAPAIYGDTLIVASTQPGIHALDLTTGKSLWNTDLRQSPEASEFRGRKLAQTGGSPWGGAALDETRGIFYITTANPGPVLVGVDRPGRNPLTAAVVAIDANNGAVLWSFQEIAHDLWDLDIAAPPVLATITRNGQAFDVVTVPTKAGNTLLLDRVTGQPIFEFRKRRAPVSTLLGERTAAYQPDLERPQPFAKQGFTAEDVTDIAPANRQFILDQIAGKTTGWFAPHVQDVQSVFFGLHGGAQWTGAALDPTDATLFIASSHEPSLVTVTDVARAQGQPDAQKHPEGQQIYAENCAACHGANLQGGGTGPALKGIAVLHDATSLRAILQNGYQAMPAVDLTAAQTDALTNYLFDVKAQTTTDAAPQYQRTRYQKLLDHEGFPGSKPPWGTLNALDLNTGLIKWRVPLGEFAELIERGLPPTGTPNFGGPLATSTGLVFVSGTKDRLIRAFDSTSGREVWRAELPFIGSAPPSSILHDGQQIIVLPATGGGTLRIYDQSVERGNAIVAFGLKN